MQLESTKILSNLDSMLALGIDIGGSGIKGAVVDIASGKFVSERIRIPTPAHPLPEDVTRILGEIVRELKFKEGPIGIGFPGVIRDNRICTAVNLHESLVGFSLTGPLAELGFNRVCVLNDADAAGIAEMEFGAGKPFLARGTVLMITVGTGLGTVMFANGQLVPNLELGHVEYNGHHAESYCSERARIEGGLDWETWGRRFNGFLVYLERLLQPDLIILGGGGVKNPELFEGYLDLQTTWLLAVAGNRAGIIGAAYAASSQ